MTKAERAQLSDLLAANGGNGRAVAEAALMTAVSVFLGLLLWAGLSALTHLTGYCRPDLPSLWLAWLSFGAGLACTLSFLPGIVRRYRQSLNRLEQIRADLAAGVIEEETALIRDITRLREEEHFTEFLLLETECGRLRGLLDDTTTNTEGRGPKQSRLRLARRMHILRFPTSGRCVTHFSGQTLRRPKALISDPRTWPADDEWLSPDQRTRIGGQSV